VQYLDDGDSEGYQEVVSAQPCGGRTEIQKLDCVGRVHKRMGF
jgi:hypothetical protein